MHILQKLSWPIGRNLPKWAEMNLAMKQKQLNGNHQTVKTCQNSILSKTVKTKFEEESVHHFHVHTFGPGLEFRVSAVRQMLSTVLQILAGRNTMSKYISTFVEQGEPENANDKPDIWSPFSIMKH